MIFNVVIPFFSVFSSVVLAAYSNTTFVPTTLTLSPTESVSTETTTLTYADETTTFYITSTLFHTSWYTPLTTSSVEAIVTDIPTTYESSGESYTSTITSTVQIIRTVTAESNQTDSGSNGCVPVTITVSADPTTKYVTADPVTEYVTVTPGTEYQWTNNTQTV